MDGFLTCVEKIVSYEQACEDISEEMEICTLAGCTFSFSMAIKDRKTKMPCKLQFVSNFNVSS